MRPQPAGEAGFAATMRERVCRDTGRDAQITNQSEPNNKQSVMSIRTKITVGFFAQLVLLCTSTTLFAKEWTLADKNLQVTFNDQTLVLKVLDKRIGKTWEQFPLTNFALRSASVKGASMQLSFTSPYAFTAVFSLTPDAGLSVQVQGNNETAIKELRFPAAFQSPDGHFIVHTDTEGLLLPVTDKEYPESVSIPYFCGGSTAMSWMGTTDKNLESGWMALVETPYDATLLATRKNGKLIVEPLWLSSLEKLGYTRKLTYYFFDKGGYVAQAKKYRRYIWPKRGVKTLKEAEQKLPAIKNMVGGVHVYVWDNARNGAFAADLKKAGIGKAMVLWNPNHLPYPSTGFPDSLKRLGYVYGVYELFTDTHPRDTANYDLSTRPTYLKRNAFPGRYHFITARKKDGSVYSNQFGHYVCPKAGYDEVVKRTAKEMAIYPAQTYFFDVYQANGIYECYSKDHPCTREEWAAALRKNQQATIDRHKTFMGAEWGADFLADQVVYAHGMMTGHRTWWGTEIDNKGTIYYGGDWRNGQRPSIMLGQRTAPPRYMQYSINEALRIPLYSLVYHDAIVTSWRWEDGNHHAPEIWWKKDLFNLLYGNAPLWSLDRDRWEAFRNTFVESYKTLHPWLQSIGYDEMLSHRFVTADRKVQETVFSSGKKMVVNFGETPFVYQSKEIKPRGFVVL